ncbi:MAG: acetyl-CoA carboxylase biotin carboxyl carrier protein subunit, partial [Burkholderiales bacterium]|nr:acetyl-CoA carboxylase biotin carboxyl carrier protein subunit [Burkholderiales bacterium]
MAATEVKSEITGTVWKILSKPGDAVSEDDVLMILESMKMEIPVTAPEDGIVKEVRVAEGDL